MTKLIKNWEELAKVPANDKYKIMIDEDMCSGWIIPVWDEPSDKHCDGFKCNCKDRNKFSFIEIDQHYFDHHVYLSTHTFYGNQYKHSTKVLQEHGFDIEIDNWDKEEK